MQTSLIGKVLVPVTIFVFLLSCTPPAQPTPPSPVTSTLPSTEPILQPPAPSAPPVVLPSPTLDIIAPEASSNVTAGTVSINIRVTGFTLKEPGGVNADGQG
ncbi:MAG: hypothetical protein HY662_04845, partial [Chloroflexi bacterium]|nr:hypothetical protein [Chloroflexota bacterium]